MAEKDVYLSWLNDAYSMEQNVEEMLQKHLDQTRDFPQVHDRIQQHLDITRSQADRVKECIQRNGGDVNSLKSGVANVMGAISGAGATMGKDKLVKIALSEFGTENFEIASYLSIIDAANVLGDTQTARICEGIVQEEQDMAQWLHQNLPRVTNIALEQAA